MARRSPGVGARNLSLGVGAAALPDVFRREQVRVGTAEDLLPPESVGHDEHHVALRRWSLRGGSLDARSEGQRGEKETGQGETRGH